YGKRFLYQAELWWIKHMVRRYEQRVYNESRLVLVNYESVRQLLHTQYGKGAEVRKLPYSSESAFLNESEKAEVKPEGLLPSLSQDDPLIVTVSRHDPRKGLDIFLRALAELRGAGVRFRACVLSGGPLLSAHRSLVEELGLSDMVIMPGFVRNPYPYLKHADLFVLPSLEEGSGSVALLEALQAGVAIVASKIDGIPEDVIDGESALLVQPGSVSALSQAIALALTDKELRERLARQARQTFIGKFSADAFTAALRDTYAELGVLI
ncbi:MAG TPA: glycosyltransferase family 4 protein, partial [Blastocatellia bacterium]|nr:glycosyltransferase family 4 protein [Blastocatellia bacterium]